MILFKRILPPADQFFRSYWVFKTPLGLCTLYIFIKSCNHKDWRMFSYHCLPCIQEDAQDLDAFTLAKSYFDLKEYDRAAYFLKGCCSQKAYFLYMYSRYLVRFSKYLSVSDSRFDRSVLEAFFMNTCLFNFSPARKRKMMRLWTVWVRSFWFTPIREQRSYFPCFRKAFVWFCVVLGPLEKGQVRNEALRELRVELSKKHTARELDGFTLYL